LFNATFFLGFVIYFASTRGTLGFELEFAPDFIGYRHLRRFGRAIADVNRKAGT
jgi:hypothetical protein